MQYKIAIGPSSFAAEDNTPQKMLEEAGVKIVPNPFGRRLTEEEIIKHLIDIDGLIAGLEPLNHRVLSSASKLKAIARVGIGTANVDFAAAEKFGIKVSNTPDAPAQAVAEMTLTALLALCRQIIPANVALHAKEWKKSIGLGLIGTKVLVVGYGNIGRRVALLLKPFMAEIIVCDPYVDKKSLLDNERLVTLEEGLKEADVVTLHVCGETVLLTEKEFNIMRDGVILLNSARGELVDEDALIKALENGKVSGAWFDAFWREPYQGRLTEFEEVLLTPHISTYTRQCRLSMETEAVNNLLRDLGVTA